VSRVIDCRAEVVPELQERGTGVEWVRRELGFEPDATQARVLNCGNPRVLLNCTRQWGKLCRKASKLKTG
jgi:hypothetical protein